MHQQLEFAVDTYVEKRLSPPAFRQIGLTAVELVVNTSKAVEAITLPEAKAAVGKFKALTTTERAALSLNFGYEAQLVRDSYCNVTGMAQVVANFNRARNWSVATCDFWQSQMAQGGGKNGTEAAASLERFVQHLYDAHRGTSCTQDRLSTLTVTATTAKLSQA